MIHKMVKCRDCDKDATTVGYSDCTEIQHTQILEGKMIAHQIDTENKAFFCDTHADRVGRSMVLQPFGFLTTRQKLRRQFRDWVSPEYSR